MRSPRSPIPSQRRSRDDSFLPMRVLRRVLRGCVALAAILWLTSTFTFTLASRVDAAEIEGVEFAPEVQTQDTTLRLHAVGLLRYMVLIKAYVAALYLGSDVPPERVLDDVPRRLEIEYFYAIDAADFASSTESAIRQNLSTEEFSEVEREVAAFNALYRSVEPGDRYALTYLPGKGTELALNGTSLGSIEGAAFGRAVFAIWFGPNAIDASLKESLLRGTE